jgi:preprotein translocase subunit YajC
MNNVQTAITAIRNMNSDEINQVVEAIKMQRTYNARTATRSLMVGDTVTFDAKTRGIITGQVIKINTKTVQVRCNRTQGLWKVTASALKQIA